MAQIRTKFIAADAVTDTKIRLSNNAYLRARNAANSADINIVRVNTSNAIEFASLPQAAGTPSVANDLVNKSYIDSLIAGIKWKAPVRAATTANITLSGTQTIDGIALIANDRVLVKDQTAPQSNGIYVVAAGAWTRATDADNATEVASMAVFVEEGTVNADRGFVCTVNTSASIVIDTTSLPFVQFTASGAYSAGNGISISASVIAVALAGTNPGLQFNSGLAVLPDPAGAVSVSASGIAVKIEASNPSLQIASNELGVKFSGTVSALAKDSTGLKVNLEASNPTLQIASNQLGVKLNAAGAIVTGASGIAAQVDTATIKINGTNQLETIKPISQSITLSGTDITNQYVDLSQVAYSAGSITLSVVGGPIQTPTTDYTVSLTGGVGGKTRITFAAGGDLVTGGAAALVSGDILLVSYEYL